MADKVKVLNAATLNNIDQLRDAITFAADDGIRLELSFITLEIEDAIAAFKKDPCSKTLRILNGHWTHGSNMLKAAAKKARARA